MLTIVTPSSSQNCDDTGIKNKKIKIEINTSIIFNNLFFIFSKKKIVSEENNVNKNKQQPISVIDWFRYHSKLQVDT